MIDLYKEVGLSNPILSGPCVTHYTSNNLIGNSFGLPYHQDYPSMASSINSIIIWFNLYDSSPDEHSIEVVTGSHNQGIISGKHTSYGYVVNETKYPNSKILTIPSGSILVMSSFLLHRTHINNTTNLHKMSLSKRIDDLNCVVWKRNKYINAYSTEVDRKLFEKYHDM